MRSVEPRVVPFMLVTLGAKTEVSEDGVDLLDACHGRIRKFLSFAQALVDRPLPPAEALDVAAQAERYFRIAFPLHVQDEELSFLPRLLGKAPPLDAALKRMTSEHPTLDAQVRSLLDVLQEIAREKQVGEAHKAALRALLPVLTKGMEAHLIEEEQVLFPAARKLLDADTRRALRDEQRARRMS